MSAGYPPPPADSPLSFLSGVDGKRYYLSAGGMYYGVGGEPYPGNPTPGPNPNATPPPVVGPSPVPVKPPSQGTALPPPGAPGNTAAPRPPLDDAWRREDQYRQIYRRQGQNVRGSYFQTPGGGQPRVDEGFWNSPEGMPLGYAHYIGQEADPNSHYGRWLADQYNRVQADFKYANSFDPAMRFGDYVDQRAKGLANEYLQLPGYLQGKGTPAWFPGRRS